MVQDTGRRVGWDEMGPVGTWGGGEVADRCQTMRYCVADISAFMRARNR